MSNRQVVGNLWLVAAFIVGALGSTMATTCLAGGALIVGAVMVIQELRRESAE